MCKKLIPLLKWAGGKRKIASLICNNINLNKDNVYFEPFLGGGAVLLNKLPNKAICCDANQELINFYNIVKNNVDELLIELEEIKEKDFNTKEFYYAMRKLDRNDDYEFLSPIKKAARFLYLNKTCYNGLWRVNRKGENNVPFGKYVNPQLYDEENIKNISKYFKDNDIKFICDDFRKIKDFIKQGDIVYFDPPYDVENGQSEFVNYTLLGFNRDDQKDLKLLCDSIVKKGAKVIISNSKTKFILDLYQDKHYNVYTINDAIDVTRTIGRNATSRKKIQEVLIIGEQKNERKDITTSK